MLDGETPSANAATLGDAEAALTLAEQLVGDRASPRARRTTDRIPADVPSFGVAAHVMRQRTSLKAP